MVTALVEKALVAELEDLTIKAIELKREYKEKSGEVKGKLHDIKKVLKLLGLERKRHRRARTRNKN